MTVWSLVRLVWLVTVGSGVVILPILSQNINCTRYSSIVINMLNAAGSMQKGLDSSSTSPAEQNTELRDVGLNQQQLFAVAVNLPNVTETDRN